MTSHVFCGIWCSSASAFALKQTVEGQDECDPMVIDTIVNSFYVDDCLKSVKCETDVENVVN